jgi:hypothetical protein
LFEREAKVLLRLLEACLGGFVWTSARSGQGAPNITSEVIALLAEAPQGTLAKILLPAARALEEETGTGADVFCRLLLHLLLQPWDQELGSPPRMDFGEVFYPVSPEDLEEASRSAGVPEDLISGLARAVWELGEGGVITMESDPGLDLKVRREFGYEIESRAEPESLGLAVERSLDGPLVAVINSVLTKLEDVQDLLEVASQYGSPLVLVSLGLHGPARKTVLLNDHKGVMVCLPVRVGDPFQWRKKDVLQDICALTGATLIDPIAGLHSLRKINPKWLGGAARVTATRTKTLILMPEDRPDVMLRVAQIDHWVDSVESGFDREWAERRKSMLVDGLCVLRVGAVSEAERQIRKSALVRGLRMLRAGIEHGFVRGGWSRLPRMVVDPCPLWTRVLGEEFGRGGMVSVLGVRRSVEMAHSIASELRSVAVRVGARG